ncbi:MAG: RagB/SusD family nutrient uptake outer membrane protein [Leadbetterella sp.]|nr:RagB/SusD family nutrient uptake outer membrane protein [Leadbetterella sp.]
MFKKIYNIVLLSLVTVVFSSCEDLINIKETDFIAGETALRTVKNNESLLIGAYANLGTEMNIRLNGVFSDELKQGDFYNAQSTHEWKYNYDDIGIRDNYQAHVVNYQIIDRVNRLLQALPNAIEETTSDADLKSRVKGEALFLRAYAHFELFRYYCDNYSESGLAMPYMELPSLETFGRLGMKEYFDKILKDLNESKSLLPNNLTDKNRASKLAATALHARIALYMRNWNDAITYSTEYIQALPLATGADFEALWKDASTTEVAFKLARNSGNRVGGIYRGVFTKNSSGKLDLPSSTSWIPSSKLYTSYSADDIRGKVYVIDEPLYKAAGRPFSYIVNKYAGTGYATTNENVADLKVFRTAEMYLIRAEARAETNAYTGANSAESDLNALRAARITGYKNVTLTSKDQAISEIMNERFKELAFEGHRFWDLKRRGLPVERLDADAPSGDSKTLAAKNFRFILPIYITEMQANPKMVQNPGYAN